MGSIGHVAAGFLASVVSSLLHLAMSDGRSVVKLESDSPLVALVGKTYGIGLFHDSRGYQWYEDEHPVNALLKCDAMRRLGESAEGFAFVALVLNALAVLIHLLGAQRGGKVFGLAGLSFHALSAVSLLISFSCAAALFDKGYCGNAPLKDNFDLAYGLPFLVVACAVSFANVGILAATGALKDGQQPAAAEEAAEGEVEAAETAQKATEPVA